VIYNHLAGDHTVGVYPLLEDDSCYFLAVDFDEAEWREDAQAFMQSCESWACRRAGDFALRSGRACLGVLRRPGVSARCPAPGHGHHQPHLRTHPAAQAGVLRPLFPNQDTMPKGGFGNLIALPLQKRPRESGCSVFVDAESASAPGPVGLSRPPSSPWPPHDIEPTILRATGGVHPLDVTFIDDEDLATPWKRESTPTKKLAGPCPSR
jgi:hypothetical protein